MYFAALIWFFALNIPAALVAGLILISQSTPNKQLSDSQTTTLICASIPSLVFMFLWTIWWGCTSWRNWSWKGILISAGIGACVVLFGLMFASALAATHTPADQPDPDTGAAVGLAFISVPVYLALFMLLTLGAALAQVWDWIHRRRDRIDPNQSPS
ncbi:MAG: hypothetical protein WBW04_01360 [Nitrolancea sp.]